MNFNEKSYTVPAGACPVPVILDTDTYNEIDDQFALVYALLTPECINLRGVTAAPFLAAMIPAVSPDAPPPTMITCRFLSINNSFSEKTRSLLYFTGRVTRFFSTSF